MIIFIEHGKNIYRVMRVGNNNGERREIPYLSPPYGPALVNDYPDAIKQHVRIMRDNDLISYNNISFNETNIYLADKNFFSFFDFHLIKGDTGYGIKRS
jgi:putative ABC transport system permease protein